MNAQDPGLLLSAVGVTVSLMIGRAWREKPGKVDLTNLGSFCPPPYSASGSNYFNGTAFQRLIRI